MPQGLLAGFNEHLKEPTLGSNERYETLKSQWTTAKKIILQLQISPESFYKSQFKFLAVLLKQQYSSDYAKRLRYIINFWGRFYSRKTKTYFAPIPALNGLQKEKLLEAREEKEDFRTASTPVEWNVLKNTKTTFENEGLIAQWNWLFPSTWFGLRPLKTDRLHTEMNKYWKLVKTKKELELWVYQSKLRSIPKPERWKGIPITLPEQKSALKIIESKNFKRPLVKTLSRIFEVKGIDTYSPRKGFTDLLLGLGFGPEDIAIFLVHRSIPMTWKPEKQNSKYNCWARKMRPQTK